MPSLALHPTTKSQLVSITSSPPHAILFVGLPGLGKRSLAVATIEAILSIKDFSSYPYSLIMEPTEDSRSISIDQIRKLEHFLSLKVASSKPINRAVLIEKAGLLTIEAQNALLKTLEEPPEGTVIIMLVDYEQSLLPTIRSRAQTVRVNKPSRIDLEKEFDSYSKIVFDKAYNISNGSPGLLSSLLNNEDHSLLTATEVARSILGKTTYERLLLIDELSKQKELVKEVLFILQQMAHVSLGSFKNKPSVEAWKKILNSSYTAEEALNNNGQLKLILTNLMLSM
jgi:DNA polymerase-3 subunit delta'